MLNRFLIPSSPLLAGLPSLPSYLGFLNTPLPTVPPTYSSSLISNSRHYLWKKNCQPTEANLCVRTAAVVWPESSFQEHAGREKTACQTSLIREQEAPHILPARACKSGYATLCMKHQGKGETTWQQNNHNQGRGNILFTDSANILFSPFSLLTSRQEFLWIILPSGFLFSY